MNRMVNYIWLAWKLAYILRTYRTCNLTVEFSKYEFNNKLLGGVTFLRVTLGVTWIQLNIYMYIYIYTHTHIYIYIYIVPFMWLWARMTCGTMLGVACNFYNYFKPTCPYFMHYYMD